MSEMQRDLDTAVRRLQLLGARPEEIDRVLEEWDDPTVWSPEERRAWVRSSDDRLLTELAALRMERSARTEQVDVAADGTVSVVDADGAVSVVDPDEQARAEIQQWVLDDVLAGSVASVLAWVDGDRDKAAAVIRHEVDGQNRTTLVQPLAMIVAGVS